MSEILVKLKRIDEEKVIYNIHRCRAGWGIIFYYDEEVKNREWKTGLSVERYYPSFKEMVEAEFEKMSEG